MHNSVYRLRFILLAAAVVFGTLMVVPDAAHADRRTSLNGNKLIVDQDDLFLYPQLMSDYENRLRLDYGANDDAGSGIVTLRHGNLVWGVALSRGTILNPQISPTNELTALGSPSLPLVSVDIGGAVIPEYVGIDSNATAVDLLLDIGNLGFRLGLGGGGTTFDPPSGGETGTSHTFVTAAGGYQYARAQSFQLDVGANLLLDVADQEDDGETVLGGTLVALRLDGRAFWKLADGVKLGSIAELSVLQQTATAEQVPGDPAAVGIRYTLGVGAGPVFEVARRTTFSTYVVSGVEVTGADPNSEAEDDQFTETRFLFPGVRAAVETALLKWFYLRTGMRYDFFFESLSAEAGGTSSSRVGGFGWDAGIGFDFGAVDIDATFNPAVVTSGTWLLSGNSQAPFAIISASFAWDELEEFDTDEAEPSQPETTATSATQADETAGDQARPTVTREEASETKRAPSEPALAEESSEQPAQRVPTEEARVTPEREQQPPPNTPLPVRETSSDATPFEPQVYSFDEEGRERIDDGTTRGTVSEGWSVWYEGEPWGTGHRVRTKNGEQVIVVEEGSFGLTREVGDVGGRTLKIQHRFSGNGFYEVLANDKSLVRYTDATYEVEEFTLPPGTTRITIKVGSLVPGTQATAAINFIEIQ